MQLCLDLFWGKSQRVSLAVSRVYTVCLEGNWSCDPAQKGLSRGQPAVYGHMDWLQRRPITQSYQDKFLAWSCGRWQSGPFRSSSRRCNFKYIEQVDPLNSGYIERKAEKWSLALYTQLLVSSFLRVNFRSCIHTHIGPGRRFVLYTPSGCSWLEQRWTTGLNYPPWM